MANNATHQLTVAIGAALSGSFGSVTSGATSKIGKIGAAVKDLEKNSTLSARSLDNLKLRYNSFLGSLNKQQAIIQKRAFYRSQIMDMVALGASLAAPINSAMKFESVMADVKKVVVFSEADGLKKLGGSLKELSREIPLSVEGLGQITAAGGQLGVKEKELLPFTTNVAKMSTAFNILPDEAGKSMATLSNVFNIPITDLTKLGDAINHIGNNSAATAKSIVPALAKAGGVARQFGLSAEKTAALAGTLIAMGRAPEEAGTAVAAILQRLQLASKLGPRAEKAFRKMGISARIFPKMIAQDAQGALSRFFELLSKVQGQERMSVLVSIFGKNYSSAVATIVGSLNKYKDQLQLVSDPKNYAGSMEKEFRTRSATTENAIQLMKNSFSELSITLGDTLLPTVVDCVTGVAKNVHGIVGWAEKNSELVGTVTKVTGSMIGMKLATFVLGYASTFLFGGLNRLVIVFKGLRLGTALAGAAFRSFFKIGPLAFIGISLAVYENWERVKSFLTGIWDTVEPHWLKFKSILDEYGITDKIMSGWNTAKNLFETIWSAAQIHWRQFKKILDEYGITDKLLAGWSVAKSLFESIWNVAEPHWNKFKLLLQEYAVVDKITAAWSFVRTFFSTIWSAAVPHWNAFIKKIESLNIADKIMASWQKLKTFFKGIWNDVAPKWDKFASPFSKIWDGAKSSVSSIGSLFKSNETKPSIASKLPPLNSAKAAPITKNQSVNVAVNVNASRISNPQETAKQVSKEMKGFDWGLLYDPVGEVA
ncbi:MAG: phage tail tape measure protein [Holosporaceae bacterium]|jgi:TP901 family phage tail tape measure protein|nr:phage tail tape measure protein [Holosporaceae bacterium]